MGVHQSRFEVSMAAVAVILCATGSSLAAGAPRVHDNAFLHGSLAAGPSWLVYDAPINTGSRHAGSAMDVGPGMELALGSTVSPGLVLGGVFIAHGQPNPEFEKRIVTQGWEETLNTVGSLGVLTRYYPDPSAGFHVEVFAGPAFHRTTQRRTVVDESLRCLIFLPTCAFRERRLIEARESSRGMGLGTGAGYEFWISDNWSLGLAARFFFAHTWSSQGRYSFIAPSIGIGFTLH